MILPSPASLAQHSLSPGWDLAFLNELCPTHAFLLFNTIGSGVSSEKWALLVSGDEELPTWAFVSLQLLGWDEYTSKVFGTQLSIRLWHFSQSTYVTGGERDSRSAQSVACPMGRPPVPPPSPHPSLLRQSFGCNHLKNFSAVGLGVSDARSELADLQGLRRPTHTASALCCAERLVADGPCPLRTRHGFSRCLKFSLLV